MTFCTRQVTRHLVVIFVHCIFLVTKHRFSEMRSYASILFKFFGPVRENNEIIFARLIEIATAITASLQLTHMPKRIQ